MSNDPPTAGARSDLDAASIFAVLNSHRVDYVVVGEYAAQMRGASRPTTDADVTPETSAENLARLATALRALKARIRTDAVPEGLPFDTSADALRGMKTLNLQTEHGDLDLAFVPDGTTGYGDLIRSATAQPVGGTVAQVAALSDIIRSKTAAGRQKDIEALPELHALARHGHRRPLASDRPQRSSSNSVRGGVGGWVGQQGGAGVAGQRVCGGADGSFGSPGDGEAASDLGAGDGEDVVVLVWGIGDGSGRDGHAEAFRGELCGDAGVAGLEADPRSESGVRARFVEAGAEPGARLTRVRSARDEGDSGCGLSISLPPAQLWSSRSIRLRDFESAVSIVSVGVSVPGADPQSVQLAGHSGGDRKQAARGALTRGEVVLEAVASEDERAGLPCHDDGGKRVPGVVATEHGRGRTSRTDRGDGQCGGAHDPGRAQLCGQLEEHLLHAGPRAMGRPFGQDHGAGQCGVGSRSDRSPVEPRPACPRGTEHFAAVGIGDHTDSAPGLVAQCKAERGPREPMSEVGGAVHRVDVPDEFSLCVSHHAEFLPDDGVVRKPLVDGLAHEVLHGAVGHRHVVRRPVLGGDLLLGWLIGADPVHRRDRQLLGEVQVAIQARTFPRQHVASTLRRSGRPAAQSRPSRSTRKGRRLVTTASTPVPRSLAMFVGLSTVQVET